MSTSMLAAVYHGPGDLRVEVVPIPAPGVGGAAPGEQRKHLRH